MHLSTGTTCRLRAGRWRPPDGRATADRADLNHFYHECTFYSCNEPGASWRPAGGAEAQAETRERPGRRAIQAKRLSSTWRGILLYVLEILSENGHGCANAPSPDTPTAHNICHGWAIWSKGQHGYKYSSALGGRRSAPQACGALIGRCSHAHGAAFVRGRGVVAACLGAVSMAARLLCESPCSTP